jgi:hypothetical protein
MRLMRTITLGAVLALAACNAPGQSNEVGRYVAVTSTNALTIVLDTVTGDLIVTQVQIPTPVVIKIPALSLAVLPDDKGLRERLIKGQQSTGQPGQPQAAEAPPPVAESPVPAAKKK